MRDTSIPEIQTLSIELPTLVADFEDDIEYTNSYAESSRAVATQTTPLRPKLPELKAQALWERLEKEV